MIDPEPIFTALFNLVKTAPGLVTTSRKLLHWSDVQAERRPALFLAQGNASVVQTTGLPAKWMLAAKLYVYVSTQGADNPQSVINPIIKSIGTKLDYSYPGVAQTLGGLVKYARIEGTIETAEGTLGNEEICIIPVVMLAS